MPLALMPPSHKRGTRAASSSFLAIECWLDRRHVGVPGHSSRQVGKLYLAGVAAHAAAA